MTLNGKQSEEVNQAKTSFSRTKQHANHAVALRNEHHFRIPQPTFCILVAMASNVISKSLHLVVSFLLIALLGRFAGLEIFPETLETPAAVAGPRSDGGTATASRIQTCVNSGFSIL